MKTMIFAAGLGTRLKPITDHMPKALVPVAGKPLIEHVLRRLASVNDDLTGKPVFEEAVVNVHHFSDMLKSWIRSWNASSDSLPAVISDESDGLLETGGGIYHAREFLQDCGNFLIHNVDIVSDADISELISRVDADALATLLVSKRKTSRYLLFDPVTMRMVGWKNIATGKCILADPSIVVQDCLSYAFSGIHIVSDRVFALMDKYIEEKEPETVSSGCARFSIMDFYLWAMTRMPIYGVCQENLHLVDVGKLDTLDQLNSDDMMKKLLEA